MTSFLGGAITGMISDSIFELLKKAAGEVLQNDEMETKLLDTFNIVCKNFYTEYKNEFGDKDNSFLARL